MTPVSIIIRARNEERHLGQLLRLLRRQNGTAAEIIVVDSGSKDETIAIAQEGADKVVQIEADRFSYGRSLNYGCAAASGDILAIISAHTYPTSNNWLTNLTVPFEDESVAMVYGRQLPHMTTRLGEARDFAVAYGPHSRVLIDEPFGNNANSAVRASLWRRHQFDETLTGLEDAEWARWAQRHGYAVRYAANAAIVHIHDESFHQVYRRFFREGTANAELFPHSSASWRSVLVRGAIDLARDVRFAWSARAGLSGVLDVPSYRVAATVGFYRGGIERERRRRRAAARAITGVPVDRAVVVTGPGKHSLTSVPHPAAGPGEVTIRVAYVGVCATDVEVADGRQAYYRDGRARFPIVPGHEYSGVIEQVGSPNLAGFVGRRVVAECVVGCGFCEACRAGTPMQCEQRRETGVLNKDGAYATRVTVRATAVHELPSGLPLLTAALVEPTAVVLKALRKLPRVRGTAAAVVGGGPIGHIAAQLLRRLGARDVLVIDRDERRLAPFTGMAFSTGTEVTPRWLEGFDVVIEATGDRTVVDSIAAAAAAETKIIVLGVPGEDGQPLRPPDSNGTQIVSSVASDARDWPQAIRLLESGDPNLDWLQDNVVPLDDYAAAWEALRERGTLKTILLVDRDLHGE
jgi:threonine dehydrogenase-like Zn-dependent dehydrogenase/glycosyltransferase involved in cell wall biosynthesis